MCRYRTFVVFALLLCPLAASAQTRAAVLADAPIYVQPGNVTPLRTAAANTELVVLADEGRWVTARTTPNCSSSSATTRASGGG